MVKRQTIALLAAEEQVPLVLTARQQALVDAVANRMLPAERNPVSPVDKPRSKARAGSGSALRRLTGTAEREVRVMQRKSGFTERSSIRLTVRSFMMPMAMVLAISRAFAKSYTTFAASEHGALADSVLSHSSADDGL